MTKSNFSTPAIGWVAIVVGIAVILAVLFLALMYTIDMSFGKVNDLFNSIIGISSVALAWMLYGEHHSKSPLTSQVALILVVVGAIFTMIGSVLIIYGFTDFVLAGWYTGIGNALIGLWLVAVCYSMLSGGTLPNNLIIFGIVTGAVMAIGLIGIAGIFAAIDTVDMPWYFFIAFFGFLGTYFLYPIWTIWLGRILLLK
jgi:hypothetical protein